jgi:hypothetical protein
MTSIFEIEKEEEDFSEKMNIDELFERKQQHDMNKLQLFNKILNRVHVRIKTTSRQKIDEQFCWFVVPEVILGVPKYDQASCIAYIMDKLRENKFYVKYYHPNTLLISWAHFVPSYVRNELKKKTGIVVNEMGERVVQEGQGQGQGQEGGVNPFLNLNRNNERREDQRSRTIQDIPPNQTTSSGSGSGSDPKKKYNPIQSYRPTGLF